ncbi:hypothetical protein M2459_000078 [Parabacteroides sp. PF5-5]|uniref:hypothetical protein n=1 Tax=unclassified Parabacteroides TaxID=2649774 RepID=UPI002473B3BD|nr:MULTISPECIES: hypothetical protein [unclassified Parabacteroides]MDH6303746.1 hypothetical protein [Parabacteroides sp. PH5-39]MDH6314363.1 hypothetical protein [Parabacteroides sp. PF5-13]MDH6318572.1 hypothetical protein [Parabacteroides sp. PH5-13]MDH6322135.1 hypothetical protein [Parabacteroides sp. PH5-8]MDH6325785.1 hypothetical protein [Parabacteroides sp. PH5-41]
MRINKDLVDAVMMLAFIILVLVWTTEFDNHAGKNILMGILGGVSVLMLVFRVLGGRQPEETPDEGFEH